MAWRRRVTPIGSSSFYYPGSVAVGVPAGMRPSSASSIELYSASSSGFGHCFVGSVVEEASSG